MLVFAVICLCGSTVLVFASLQEQYIFDSTLDFIWELPKTLAMANAAPTLWWLVIFPVKLAFLFFFRRLIINWRKLHSWWWCGMLFTVAGLPVQEVAD